MFVIKQPQQDLPYLKGIVKVRRVVSCFGYGYKICATMRDDLINRECVRSTHLLLQGSLQSKRY